MLARSLIIPSGVAVGMLVSYAPALWRRLRGSTAIARALRDERRAVALDDDQLAAFDARHGPLSDTDTLDQRTWDELDLMQVFRRLDRTASQPGRQLLYHLLRRSSLDAASAANFDARVRRVQADATLARSIRTRLQPLRGVHAAAIEAAAFGALPARPAFWWVFPALTVASLTTLAASAVQPALIAVWLVFCTLNMVAQALYRPRVREFVPAMRELPAFIDTCAALGRTPVPGFEREGETLAAGATQLAAVRRTTLWLRFDATLANEVAGSLYEYANLLFLLDLTAFVLTTARLHAERATLQVMFRAIGMLDVVQSVAAWRDSLGSWCTPVVSARAKALRCTDVRHPLLDDGVPNTLDVSGTSVLLTGSNMSGKTTFLRIVGVNTVLAQSIATVCAVAWVAPVLRVRSSIGQRDSLLEGRSYYLAEVESVRRMIDAKEGGAQHLFLLDELFRGTNTPERVAAGFATLRWLDRGDDIVCVATHDIELHGMLGARFAAHHFREEVTRDALTFDYRLRPGVASTRNAIALLTLTGFPPELVATAHAVVDGGAGSRATPAAGP